MDGFSGLIAIEIKCAGTTVRTVVSVKEPTVAVMVVEPDASVAASPEPSIVATEVDEELHVTPPLRSELLPSLYVAVATNCWLMPMPKVSPSGVTAIETMLGAVTVRLVDCETPPRLAEMLVVPAFTEFTRPVELTVAVAVADELHETRFVISALLPSP
jgi:hypothetical protein